MFNLSNATIQQVSAHFVGNPSDGGALRLSEEPLALDDEKLPELLRTYFLSGFAVPEYYSFTFSNEDFSLNPIYQFAKESFEDIELLHENSINIAKHLFSATKHPNIKSGELYVALIDGVEIDGVIVNGLGIFKSENKENYLKLSRQFNLHADEGTNIRKLDKGCLILNTNDNEGYKVLIVDATNKSDAQFWKQDFLHIKPWSDAFHHTNNFMQMTQQYVSEQLGDEFAVSKADKIDLLNRSMTFFKNNEEFNKAEFETSVLGDVDVIESFRKYGKTFMGTNDFDVIDSFEISAQAVKRQAKVFKSVLKLDKNFHVYIHGDRERIEKGYDEVMGMNYYKLYFTSES
jgi:hypothetical protein